MNHNYIVTYNFINGMKVIVPVYVDYDTDTENFDETIIEDADALLSSFMAEASQTLPINFHRLSETIDVDVVG